MKQIITILLTIFTLHSVKAQVVTQSWVDPCSGEVKVITVPLSGSTVVTMYNQSRVVTTQDVLNGTLTSWIQGVYTSYNSLGPCSQNQAQTTTTQQNVQQAAQEAAKAASQATTQPPPTQTTQTTTQNTGTNGNNQTTTSSSGSQDSNQSSTSSGDSSGDGTSSNDSSSGNSGSEESTTQESDSSGSDQGSEDTNSQNEESTQEESSTESEGGEDSSEEGSDSESKEGDDSEGEEGDSEESSDDEQESEEEVEEEESTEEESSEEESEEEEPKKKKKKKRGKNTNPPIVVANISTMESLDGRFTTAMTLGISRSSMRGDKNYGLTSMIWTNGKQYMLMGNFSKIFFSKGKPKFIYSAGLVGSRMFSTLTAGNNHSLVYLEEKGGVYGLSIGLTGIYLNYEIKDAGVLVDQSILSGSVTSFFTKPYKIDRVTISPMLAVSSPFYNYDMYQRKTSINKELTIITGASANYALTKRFVANLGVNIINNTDPAIRSLLTFTIGSRFQF